MMQSIQQLYESGNYDAIALAVRNRFGVELEPSDLKASIDAVTKKRLLTSRKERWGKWSDCTWFMFLKNRIAEIESFPSTSNTNRDCISEGCTAVMHVFFLYLEETPEMLNRLRGERKDNPQIPRSKLTKDNVAIVEPVDSTAAKVAAKR